MAQNPNLRLAQQQQANLARAYASSYSRPSRILATSPSAPQKSASELMEERLLPLRERQQRMQMEEYFGGAGTRAQQEQLATEQTRQSLGLLPLQTQQQRQQIGEYLGGIGLRSQQSKLAEEQTRQSLGLLPLQTQQQRQQIGEYLGGIGLRSQQSKLAEEQTRQSLGLLPLQTQQQQMQIGEYLGGAGLRAQQQALAGTQTRLGQAEADIGIARIGDVGAAGRRAYTFGREEEELNRLRMAAEGRKLQGQMSFQPQMEAIRGGIMGRMASRLGVSLPAMGGTYYSGTGYTPSWMQSLQSPQFPRYS